VSHSAVIVGGGLGGLSTAIVLGRLGMKVTLVESALASYSVTSSTCSGSDRPCGSAASAEAA
jgi:2-polyprenyl-6-methoxyphenol hydroxylase-like FAD-dependent oxidoreductase